MLHRANDKCILYIRFIFWALHLKLDQDSQYWRKTKVRDNLSHFHPWNRKDRGYRKTQVLVSCCFFYIHIFFYLHAHVAKYLIYLFRFLINLCLPESLPAVVFVELLSSSYLIAFIFSCIVWTNATSFHIFVQKIKKKTYRRNRTGKQVIWKILCS